MSTMVDAIVKSPFLRRMDHMSELRKGFDMALIVADFDPNSGIATLDLCIKYGVATSQSEIDHVRKHWLGPNEVSDPLWFTHPQNEKIIRRALFEAVKLVQSLDLPLDVYWVCYPDKLVGEDRAIEIVQSVNSRQITVIFITPFPRPGAGNQNEPQMWITRWEDDPANPGTPIVNYRPVKL